MATKKSTEAFRYNKYFNGACRDVTGFQGLLQRFERNISILGRSPCTIDNYSRHINAEEKLEWSKYYDGIFFIDRMRPCDAIK